MFPNESAGGVIELTAEYALEHQGSSPEDGIAFAAPILENIDGGLVPASETEHRELVNEGIMNQGGKR